MGFFLRRTVVVGVHYGKDAGREEIGGIFGVIGFDAASSFSIATTCASSGENRHHGFF